ncbi:MAG TPA: LamG domain-containing protein [Myxococcaceae bacterium]|nr:LamG domain-containing protein [Myxococcaceae bacterium]
MLNARSFFVVTCFLFCLASPMPSRAEGSLRGLLLRFDEPEGRRFTDYSGSGHTITPVGSVTRSTTDKVSGASSVCFDGNGYLEIDASSDFYFDGDLTIDFWFKSSHESRQHALTIGSALFAENIDFNFVDGTGFWLYWNSGGTNAIRYGTPLQYMNGAWHHVAMVRSQGTIKAYIDGIARGGVTYTQPLGSNTRKVRVGSASSSDSGAAFGWHGCIDELRIINGRALWNPDDNRFDPMLYLAPPLNAFR